MIDELLLLVNDGKVVLEIGIGAQSLPPKYLIYRLADGSDHKLEIDMTMEEFWKQRDLLRAWLNALHKIKFSLY
jgi:hypothetical protein